MFDAKRVALKLKLQGDFYFFCRYAFMQMTSIKWSRNWHHETLCLKMEQVFNGECKRLIVNMPPRYSKTEIIVVMFIAWALCKNPDSEFIHASYSGRLAGNNTARVRDIVTSDWYREIFPNVTLDGSTGGKDYWRTSSGGVVYASGAGGTITGFGAGKLRNENEPHTFAGAIIIDDPHKADEANSDTMRQNVIDWYDRTVRSRVNDPQRTPIILVMQRLHENDLAGWLLKGGSGETWDHLCIPAIGEDGRALWPAKHTLEQLDEMKAANEYVFAGQYMQRPAPLGGGIFKRKWWQYYQPGQVPPIIRIIHSWDTAFKTKTHNDPSSGTVWAECESGYYLLDRVNDRLPYPELKRRVKLLNDRYKASAILVEDKASGQSLIQDLQKTSLPIIPIKVEADKVSRAFATTGIVQSGRVHLPMGAPWLEDYLSEMSNFPNAAHDDDVDSTTQALNYLNLNGGNTGLLDWMKQQAKQLAEQKAK